MKRIGLAIALAIPILVVINARAQDDEGCSITTLTGSFGIQVTGSIVANGPIGSVAEVGVIEFDGAGGASQTTTISLNGTIISNRSSLSGSYQINSDCTGDFAFVLPVAPGITATSTSHFVVVDHGREIRLVNSGVGRVLSGNARKIQK